MSEDSQGIERKGDVLMPYNTGRIWSLLASNPGISASTVAQRLKIRTNVTSSCLYRMKLKGHTRCEGVNKYMVWFAIGKRPEDMRGTHVNSLPNLRQPPHVVKEYLRRANRAKGLDPDKMGERNLYKPRNPYTGELERCWSMPFSCTSRHDKEA